MSDTVAAGLQQAIEASVDAAFDSDDKPSTVVSHWVVVAEVVCDDGTVRLHRDYSDNIRTWQAAGMLRLVADELTANFNRGEG